MDENRHIEGQGAEECVCQHIECQEGALAKVDIVTSERKVTMSAPVKEFEEFRISFKSMMMAFANFIEAAGLEVGRDDTSLKIEVLNRELEGIRRDMQAREAKVREESVSLSLFEEYKAAAASKEATMRGEYVPQSMFDGYKAAVEARDAGIRREYVPQSLFNEFKAYIEAKEARSRGEYVPRSNFDEFKAAVEARESMRKEDFVTRAEFIKFRNAVREVI